MTRRIITVVLCSCVVLVLGGPGSGACRAGDASSRGVSEVTSTVPSSPAFEDVPPDHPAYRALRRLAEAGLLDDEEKRVFRGKRVLTRYEFAKIVARMLAKMESLEKEGRRLTEEERALRELAREFLSELELIGVRVRLTGRRVDLLQKRTRRLEDLRSKLRMSGFYRVKTSYTFESYDYSSYPFLPHLHYERMKDDGAEEPGLSPIENAFHLRLSTSPYLSSEHAVFNPLEVFVEIKGVLNGLRDSTLVYGYNEDFAPWAGDTRDSFATRIEDDRRVLLNKAHFSMKAKSLRLRLFANESARDLDDPFMLFDSTVFGAFSGVEAEGKAGRYSYRMGVLKKMEDRYRDRDSFLSLEERFDPDVETDDTDDFYIRTVGRLSPCLHLGLTYNEVVFDYGRDRAFNEVTALDLGYRRRTAADGDLGASLSVMRSEGLDLGVGFGFKLDGVYRSGGLLVSLNSYFFDWNFRAMAARRPWLDTDLDFNFHRTPVGRVIQDYEPEAETDGERLVRLEAKYDFDSSLLSSFNDLKVAMMYETKWFDARPGVVRPGDGSSASRFYVQVIGEATDRFHFEFKTELMKDLDTDGGGEEGSVGNLLRFDYRLRRNTALIGEFEFWDDFDARAADGSHFAMRRYAGQVNLQPTDAVYLQYRLERVENAIEQPDGIPWEPVEGRDLWTGTLEATFTLNATTSLRGGWRYEKVDNERLVSDNYHRHTLVGELNLNFTRAFKVRWVHAIDERVQDVHSSYDPLVAGTRVNDYVSILYRPTENTDLLLTYGDEYEDPEDPLDDGMYEFASTAKVLRLKAQTAF